MRLARIISNRRPPRLHCHLDQPRNELAQATFLIQAGKFRDLRPLLIIHDRPLAISPHASSLPGTSANSEHLWLGDNTALSKGNSAIRH